MNNQLRCNYCNKFIKEPFDEYTNFGSSIDIDPPDPILMCQRCVDLELINMVQRKWVDSVWIPAHFHWVAAAILGWVRITPRTCGWGNFWDGKSELSSSYYENGYTIIGPKEFLMNPKIKGEFIPGKYGHVVQEE